MANKRAKPEEIVSKLRQVEVLVGQGMPRADGIRQTGVTEQTSYRRRKKYSGMGVEQLKELKKLQKESEPMECQWSEKHWRTRLRRAVSDLILDKLCLAEAARGAEGQRSAPLSPARRRRRSTKCGKRLACRIAALAASWASTVPHDVACRSAVLMRRDRSLT